MNVNDIQKKIGQLMVVGFDGKTATPEIKKMIREHHVGGIILFARNIGTPKEVLKLTTELQRTAKEAGHEHPLLICVDQENGVVRRLGEGSTIFPGSMLLGATGKRENAYITGLATGKELKALGINWNLAPVLDINNNPNNPVIGVRSYGESPTSVSDFGTQAVRGLNEAGVITTLKHFPGHGDTEVDSHLDLPVISHDMNRLMEMELIPFIECITQGADVIMTAHVYFPAIESTPNVPATLSKNVVTKLLREKLDYNGVVTTDCMEMQAISNGIGTAKGSVEALKAGVDLIMISHTHYLQYEAINAIKSAISSNELTISALNNAYERVMNLKRKYLKWEDIAFQEDSLTDYLHSKGFGSEMHKEKSLDIYRQGITILKNESNLIPLQCKDKQRILVVYPKNKQSTLAEDKKYSTFSLEQAVQAINEKTEAFIVSNPPTAEEIANVGKIASSFDVVIIGTLSVEANDAQTKLVQAIKEKNKSIIVIATRNPYDIAYLPDIPVYINTYEYNYPALMTAIQAVFGKIKVSGKSPVTIPNME